VHRRFRYQQRETTLNDNDFTVEELDTQHAAELPGRSLMAGISLLGIPLLGIDGVSVNVNTAGPHWLA
jgi:hypothetical protein